MKKLRRLLKNFKTDRQLRLLRREWDEREKKVMKGNKKLSRKYRKEMKKLTRIVNSDGLSKIVINPKSKITPYTEKLIKLLKKAESAKENLLIEYLKSKRFI